MFSKSFLKQVAQLLDSLRAQRIMLATAESCTGCLISALLTEIAGSSDVFDCGFVTYSNTSKTSQLGVPAALIKRHGAVSEPVAAAMAKGALKFSRAYISIAVTGIAGPGGGTKEKPVGLVYIAFATRNEQVKVEEYRFKGSRATIRMQAVRRAIDMLKGQ